MKRFALALGATLVAFVAVTGSARAQASPEFKLGFKLVADQIPEITGRPLENEHFNVANGDSLQMTSNGLMVWRKADNWTAFTNGSHTWVNGPFGIQDRDNAVRFDWEAKEAPAAGPASIAPPPPSAPVPPAAQPKATDQLMDLLRQLLDAQNSSDTLSDAEQLLKQ